MRPSVSKLTRKIKWACDLHAAEIDVLAQNTEKERVARKIMRRAAELFTAGLLCVAIVVMWAAITLRLV